MISVKFWDVQSPVQPVQKLCCGRHPHKFPEGETNSACKSTITNLPAGKDRIALLNDMQHGLGNSRNLSEKPPQILVDQMMKDWISLSKYRATKAITEEPKKNDNSKPAKPSKKQK